MSVQSNQEVGGTDPKFKDLDNNVIRSYEEYAAEKGGNVAGDIDSEIHSKMVKIYWFKNL